MSLPWKLQETFSPEEIQFIVENEPIKIFPRFTTRSKVRGNRGNKTGQTRWKLLTASDEPLNNLVAIQTTEVAFWIALLLKQQGKCSIVAPGWLRLTQLQRFIDYELKNTERFSELPWNWLVVAQLLFSKAADDLQDPVHLLRGKVQDLREIRLGKIGQGLKHLNESHLQLDNLSLLEINELRPFVLGVMNKLKQVHGSIADEQEEEQ
ncbi:LANO_0F06040g1_1 [Lachancea nothofagi CBS 11611]|uniref:DNA replication complex GINS protein PSF2 n=1 Tax=Lachancea nothofagi CBS 11611 TaxID=1266666 RepID=A0A1G4K8I4_9SACH|nr:LANO_0F06040g1_1 [Lachancea nothofagi CBS 11611]